MIEDNWRVEMEQYTSDKNEIRLLREGPKSWMQAMRLGTLKQRYKKIMGIKDPEPPNCQSSFKEFSEQA